MANINRPNGFEPIGVSGQGVARGKLRRYYKGTTAGIIAKGDPVVRLTNSADTNGIPEIVRHTTGAAVTGVVVGVEVDPTNPSQSNVLLSADTGYVYVDDDPNSLFIVQEGGSGTALDEEDIGQHIDCVAAIDADTSLGRSKYEIDKGALATDNTWVLVEKLQSPDNEFGAYCKWVVKANLHTEANAGATNVSEI